MRRYTAVFTIQSFLLDCLQRKKDDRSRRELSEQKQFEDLNFRVHDFAAARIQAAYRGWWVRDCLAVDHFCASRIQRIVRGFFSRLNYELDTYCVIIAQGAARRYITRRSFFKQINAVSRIQALVRGYLARKKMGRWQVQKSAAIKIQCAWRSYDAQMNFMNRLVRRSLECAVSSSFTLSPPFALPFI